ncbi:hypothetical protein PI126_g22225 [Phytophthora idaei]|nr:hypothetical protein PI126_g22225 [Phytophthora idaei]
MLYILNNRVFPKWFYSYDSSVTRTQREMTHHLVAYVFQVLPGHVPMTQQNQQQVSERNNVVVLARQASPGFLLVSYRRSGGSSKNPGCLLPAIDTSTADNMQAASSEILSASWKVHEHQQQHLQQQQWLQQQRFQQRLQIEQETRQRQQPGRLQSTQTRPSAVAAPFARSLNIQTIRDDGSDNQTPAANLTIPSEVAGDVEFWQREVEATAPGFREKEQQLLILWYFLEYVSMDDLGVNSDSLTAHVRPHWLHAASVLRAPSLVSNAQLVASFLRNILELTPNHSHAHGSLSFEHTTTRVCGYLFIRSLWSRAVQQRLRVACQVEDSGMNKRVLREKFAALNVDLWDILNDNLREVMGGGGNTWSLRPHQADTLPALVDDVMSITYRQSRFGEARTKISALLLDLQTPSSLTGAVDRIFRVFMVQLQETIIASEQGSHQQQARILEGSKWCRRWLLEPGSLHVVDVESGASSSTALLSLTQLIRDFGCIDVKVTQRAVHSMSLRAAFPLSTGMTAPMNLVLDGRIRVFRALPSGISSSIAVEGWFCR